MQTKATTLAAAILLLIALPAHSEAPQKGAAPSDPNFKFTPEDFGVGRKHVANAWCNRQIDRLLDETRTCFNTQPAKQCEGMQKRNSKKIGGYIKSPRCGK
jgi:hypothetical protein